MSKGIKMKEGGQRGSGIGQDDGGAIRLPFTISPSSPFPFPFPSP